MNSVTRTIRPALLFIGCLAVSSFVYVEHHAAFLSWAGSVHQPTDKYTANSNSESRRKLSELKLELNETVRQQQMKGFLGGLYPPMDSNMMPLYLRDSLDENKVTLLDMYSGGGQAVAKSSDVVFFWHIPRAMGSTMKNIMNFCFDLKRAERLNEEPSMEYVRNNILNMDTSSPGGLAFSFANQLVNSGKVDVVISNYFLSGSVLFTDVHYGKTFTILRHPVDAALSLFHYRRSFHKNFKTLSFSEHVDSDSYLDNWMVRHLTGTMPWVELNESHLERAKIVMKQKIFVGIMTELGETLRQLKAHFGWQDREPLCANNFLHNEPSNVNDHPGLQGGRGGDSWNLVANKDRWDFGLYYYGLELFAEQRERYPPTSVV
ncbi:hypothetical protein ACHAXR_003238 [Thalassiosira sp. AJA248-18]